MTAVDVINEIKTLSPEEQAEVIRFVYILEAKHITQPAQTSQVIDDRAFEAAAEQVLNRHSDLLQKLAT